MIRPLAHYAERHISRIVVLHDGPNPSTDIYLRNRLSASGYPPVHYVDIASPPGASGGVLSDSEGGVFVIICRYINSDWLKALEGVRSQLAGVACFIDDDLPAMQTDRSLPLRYRFRIWRRFTRHVDRLSALASQLWFATPALEEKYGDHGAALLPPLYLDRPAETDGFIRYFYHGSAAHKPEMHFLAKVVREVQRRDPRMLFEIIGDRQTRALFHGIERVVVLHPMDWPSYLAYSTSTRQDIGLAPLFESPVNAARSHSKVYDITRSGAVGIYSDRTPYADVIRDGENGLLLPDTVDHWVDGILGLAANAGDRRAMALAARARCALNDDRLQDLPGFDGLSREVGLVDQAGTG